MIIENGSTPTIVFLMVDEVDDETAETSLAGSITAQISKGGGSFNTVTNSVAEIANGWYSVALTATETNTDGPLIFRATATGANEWRDMHEVQTGMNFNQALTEAYATDGAAATATELLYMIWSMLAEKAISSTTLTTKQLDGVTTSMTFTLNDSDNPTSITRST